MFRAMLILYHLVMALYFSYLLTIIFADEALNFWFWLLFFLVVLFVYPIYWFIALRDRKPKSSKKNSSYPGETGYDHSAISPKMATQKTTGQMHLEAASEPAKPSTSQKEATVQAETSQPDTLGPRPQPLLHPTPENFEEHCQEWCLFLGYQGAVKTQNSKDGGIDIKSGSMIAQVKFQASPVGVKPIRELNGVRRQGEEVLFFSLNGYTPEARREASDMGITLIRVWPLEGQIDTLT